MLQRKAQAVVMEDSLRVEQHDLSGMSSYPLQGDKNHKMTAATSLTLLA